MKKIKLAEWPLMLGSIFLCLFVGLVGGIATSSSVQTWYLTLVKPVFTPPNWLFGPIWTTLYILMGIALFLVLREGVRKENVKTAVYYFVVQLLLNFAWSFIFFYFKSLAGGLIIILELWLMILLTMRKFYRISKAAAWLMAPYIAWVTIATLLNFSLMLLNPVIIL